MREIRASADPQDYRVELNRRERVSASVSSLADTTLQQFLDALAADHPTPGAGAAAAVTLALAAASACKAVNISLKHRPDHAPLVRAREQLQAIAARAISGADEDAKRFAAALHSQDPHATERLTRAEVGMQRLSDSLLRVMNEVEGHIAPVVRGDMVAAAALCKAARVIEAENLEESTGEHGHR
jgi:formiminotetrahydrofolate cyclodeaminase